jgi:hypothetical protein
VIVLAIAFQFWCLLAIRGRQLEVKNTSSESDIKLYQRVVDRLRSNENYYEALGSELRKGGFPTRSVFNWRTPLHLTAVAAMGDRVSVVVLGVLAAVAVLMATVATQRDGGLSVVQFIVTAAAVSECFVNAGFHLVAEVWAGAFLLISAAAYSLRAWPLAVAAGIGALFLRELSLPYLVVCLVIAVYRHHRAEALAWAGGLCAWAVYFFFHAHSAITHVNPNDIPLRMNWISFAGARFLVQTVRMSLLGVLPNWVAAVVLPIILVGIGGWLTKVGSRVAAVVAVYMAAFSIVGLRVNLYWGAITNPLLAFGLAWFIPSVRDLGSALRSKTGPVK